MSINKRRGLVKLDFALKDYIQDKILYYTFTLSPHIVVFKGGTALFKVYKSPRFSLDLDLTAEDAGFLNKVKGHLRKEGFKVYTAKKMRRGDILTLVWNIGAKGLGGTGLKVEVRVSQDFEEHEVLDYESVYPDIKPFKMRVVTIEYMFRRKIYMLIERGKARDLFDAYFIARTYNTKITLSKKTWEEIVSKISRFRKSWRTVELLLINYPLPQFEKVLKVIRQHVEVS